MNKKKYFYLLIFKCFKKCSRILGQLNSYYFNDKLYKIIIKSMYIHRYVKENTYNHKCPFKYNWYNILGISIYLNNYN